MKAQPEYLTQRPVVEIRPGKNKQGHQIVFDGGASMTLRTDEAPDIKGLSLLQVVRDHQSMILKFGLVQNDLSIVRETDVEVAPGMLLHMNMPGYTNEDRDLTIPAYPTDREAAGPVT